MKQKGFSLIEVMIVVLIVGVLMGVTVPLLRGMLAKAKLTQMVVDVSYLSKTLFHLYMYRTINNTALSTLDMDDVAGEFHVNVPEDRDDFVYSVTLVRSGAMGGGDVTRYSVLAYTINAPGDPLLFTETIQLPNHPSGYSKTREINSANGWAIYLKSVAPDATMS